MEVFVNIQTNDLYRHHGKNEYTNLRSGRTGFIKPELTEKIFKPNEQASRIINEYPEVESLINKLNLKFYQNE